MLNKCFSFFQPDKLGGGGLGGWVSLKWECIYMYEYTMKFPLKFKDF